ncbi:ATP-grasp fold amidoligase family protein [Pengzhenrongella frigida]|nr:ATP-grasp fold amidoligase family protein [Cellulomonas sp. HLT2-17]
MILLRRARNRAIRAYRTIRSQNLRAPSYTYKRHEAGRVLELMREFSCSDPVFAINGKDKTHEWARALGVRIPDLLGTYAEVGDLPWEELPEQFVIKPFRGSTSMGVFLLQRVDGGWRELRSGRDIRRQDVEREYRDLVATDAISSAVLVEKLIVDPRMPGLPPIDYKVYTFFGRVGLIVAKSHERDSAGGGAGFRIFDPQWRDLSSAFSGVPLDPTIPLPVRRRELLELASLVSSAVPRAALRVDLFEDADGVVLGEITPEPGGRWIARQDIDRALGAMWEEAEARLRVRFARAGQLTPGQEPQPEALLERSSIRART